LLVCASFLGDPSQIADQWSPAAAPEEETAVAAPPYGEIDPTTGELVPYDNDREYVPRIDLPSKNDLVFLKSSTVGFTFFLEASLGSVIFFLPSM